MRDRIVAHALKVDKVLRATREEGKDTFTNRVFTRDGYKAFKRNKLAYLMKLQKELMASLMRKHVGALLSISEKYKEELAAK